MGPQEPSGSNQRHRDRSSHILIDRADYRNIKSKAERNVSIVDYGIPTRLP